MSKQKIEWEKEYDTEDMEVLKASRKLRIAVTIEISVFFLVVLCFLIYKAVHAASVAQYTRYMAVGTAAYICFAILLHTILYKAGQKLKTYGKEVEAENGNIGNEKRDL